MEWIRNSLGGIYGDFASDSTSQFLLSTANHKIIFFRPSVSERWWRLESDNVSLQLSNWTHVVVTWQHLTGKAGKVFIYADGKVIGYRSYSSGEQFKEASGALYKIGRGRLQRSVMDLYVFGTALSLDEIIKLRGERFISYTCLSWARCPPLLFALFYLFIYLFIYLFEYLSIYLFIYLFVFGFASFYVFCSYQTHFAGYQFFSEAANTCSNYF